MNTSEILKKLRKERGLSQAKVAESLGIDRTTYVKYESGGSISLSLRSLADFFGVPTDYLLGREPPAPKMQKDRSSSKNLIPKDGFQVSDKNPEEEELLKKYRLISPEHKDIIQLLLTHFVSKI